MNTTTNPPRHHKGHRWVDFTGLQEITGYSRARLFDLAGTDPDFPAGEWLDGPGRKAGHRQWYRLDAVEKYAAALRARHRKPLPDYDGDPDTPLPLAEAAEVWDIKPTAFRRYIYRSIPMWTEGRPGLVPFPVDGADVDDIAATTPRHWRWTARQLRDHPRPGHGKKSR